ncbi:hypothetical protein [Pelagibacterium lacus]|uniref:Uncharacterized protein n=1 Tax=Pelagibacterium lacus TaxID=2282655 RepID=A0A369VZV5_9HYPH|nr:hypothetical protein [Pelagibacterium lacus]RDE07944.1 hypothetical protein DVH29_14160 [Pelagibacterium lacus]
MIPSAAQIGGLALVIAAGLPLAATPFAVSARSLPVIQSEDAAGSGLEAFCEAMSRSAAWAEDWQCVRTRIFEDNPVQRSPVIALRERAEAGEPLEPVEQAILAAAPRAGIINFCNKQKGGNAFLIRHDGRPAVVTSAHMLTDSSGQLACSVSELRNSTYMPNTS